MNILIISVGKKSHDIYTEVISEFEKRLMGYTKLEWSFIPHADESNIEKSIEKESQAILAKCAQDDKVILLDEKGKMIHNQNLLELIDTSLVSGIKRLVFIIGGAYGVSDEVKKKTHHTFAISGLVFPHLMVRAILVEQLYRTFNLREGGKYHHQ